MMNKRRSPLRHQIAVAIGALVIATVGFYGGYHEGHTELPKSFAMDFSGCLWTPPSPAAALATLSYFYGIKIGITPEEYEEAILNQLESAGRTPRQAVAEMKWLDGCFADYETPPDKRNH